jgi:hypothetical protein
VAVSIDYAVPQAGRLVSRRAGFEVVVDAEDGRVRRAVMGGVELWSRLAEAVTLRPISQDEPMARLEAVATALQVVENAVEPSLPSHRCGQPTVSPAVLVRQCDGLTFTMTAATIEGEWDRIEVAVVDATVD